MAFKKIEIYKPVNLEGRKKTLKGLVTEKDYSDIIEFLRLLANGEVTGKDVSDKRLVKILDMLILFFKNFNKPLKEASLEDMRTFKEKFSNDKIKKENKENYSDETKEDCCETICRFLELQYPEKLALWINAKTKMSFRKWFIIKAQFKTPEILTEQEIETLYKNCKNATERFLISVLFDSGCRASEFYNIRFEDIQEPTEDFPYYRVDLKEEYSKTNGRIIGLFWKHSNEAIKDYLMECDKSDKKKAVFQMLYDNARALLNRIGKKALKKKLHFHLFRKSSVTYYRDTHRISDEEAYNRYGWEYGSDMLKIYKKRSKTAEFQMKEKIVDTSMTLLSKENQDLKTNLNIQKEELSKFKSEFEHQKQKFSFALQYIFLKSAREKNKNKSLEFEALKKEAINNLSEEDFKLFFKGD